MANFIEFEYGYVTHSIDIDSIKYITIEDVSRGDKENFKVSVQYIFDFYFKTQAEAQELYDKLKGKEENNLKDEIIKIVESTVERQQKLKYEEWVYNQANGFCDIASIIKYHAYKPPIAENATTSKTETNEFTGISKGPITVICPDYADVIKPYAEKLYQISEVIKEVESIHNLYHGEGYHTWNKIKYILEEK